VGAREELAVLWGAERIDDGFRGLADRLFYRGVGAMRSARGESGGAYCAS